MKEKYTSIAVILLSISIINGSCITNSDCQEQYLCEDTTCNHKGVFPLSVNEIIIFLFISISFGISNICGIGGGIISTFALIWVENFSVSEAVPITTAIMLLTSTWKFYYSYKFKIKNPEVDFADYRAAAVFVPMMLFGVKIGTIMNQILPFIIPSICLLLLTIQISYKIFYKYKEQRNIEISQKNSDVSGELIIKRNKELEIEDYELTIGKRKSFSDVENSYSNLDTKDLQEEQILFYQNLVNEEKHPFPLKWVKSLISSLVVYFIDLVIEGNSRFPSLFNVTTCSDIYWLLFIASSTIYFYLVIINMTLVSNDLIDKIDINPNYISIKEDCLCLDNKTEIILFSLICGIICSSLGIGSGTIFTPYLLSLGFSSKTSSSTTNLIIVITSCSSTIMYVMMGSLKIYFVILIAIPCMISCYLSSYYLIPFIQKSRRHSVLLFMLFWILVISTVIFLISLKNKITFNSNNDLSLLEFSNYCNK